MKHLGHVILKWMASRGCNFLPKGTTWNFSADSVRAYVFQQLLCIT